MSVDELHRIKQWHLNHREDHPVEYHMWDAMLTLWLVGWVGWLPAYAFDALWSIPLCLLAIAAPGLYSDWRRRAHLARKVRCDWIAVAPRRGG
jgi:hypothetical protein